MSQALPILYSFRRCPYAMRARLALSVSGMEMEHREVDLKQRPPELYAASPKGTVPVVVLADGQVLEESLEIMIWALEQHDPESWLPQGEEAIAQTRTLIARNDGDFKFHLDRYKYSTRYEDVDALEHRTAIAAMLQDLDTRLEATAYLLGPKSTLADFALAPFVRQCAFADKDWFDAQPWPQLQAWLERFLQSERFLGIMQKHDVWSSDETATS
ncbi:MAG: glutathione S-transferase [Planctomycetota bacterium]